MENIERKFDEKMTHFEEAVENAQDVERLKKLARWAAGELRETTASFLRFVAEAEQMKTEIQALRQALDGQEAKLNNLEDAVNNLDEPPPFGTLGWLDD